MIWAIASCMILIFCVTFRYLRLVDRGRTVIKISGEAVALMRDPSASDLEKERRTKRYSLRLMGLLLILLGGGLTALIMPLVFVWGLNALGFVDQDEVLNLVVSVPFILFASAVTVGVFWWLERNNRTER